MGEFFAARVQLAISDYIFAETHAYFARSVPKRLQIMRDLLGNPVVVVHSIDRRDREQVLTWLSEYEDKAWSFVDAMSFALIQRQKIPAAVSFDQRYGQPGGFRYIC